jgi:galactose-1-phosphate uridylyltransferase
LKLEKLRERARILDPRAGLSEIASEIEVRVDPLTGARTRINVSRTMRPKQVLKSIEAGSMQNCPFCPENILRETPEFPHDMVQEGRIRYGGALLFPNLFPLAGLHGVCVFSPPHELDIGRIRDQEINDGISCCKKFFAIGEGMGQPHHYLGWNHLPPAGASILHPHFQAILSKNPLMGVVASMDASKKYSQREGRIFWDDLIVAEKNSPRYIGESAGFVWLAPWAPTGAYEVMGISSGKASLLHLDENEIRGLSEGLVKVLKGFSNLGVASVNMGILSAPGAEEEGYYRVNLKITSRPSGGISDRALLELYGGEVAVTTLPEDYSSSLRTQFKPINA